MSLLTLSFPILGISFAALIYGFVTFDRLMRFQFEHHREAWERDGKPYGVFWQPRNESAGFWSWSEFRDYQRGRLGGKIQMMKLIYYRTPVWISESPNLPRTLRNLRIAAWVWNLGLLTCFTIFQISL